MPNLRWILVMALAAWLLAGPVWARDLTAEDRMRIDLFKKNFLVGARTLEEKQRRRDAVGELMRVDHPEAVKLLAQHVLKDADSGAVFRGVKALSEYKAEDTLEAIRAEGLASSNAIVRAACVEAVALGMMQGLMDAVLPLAGDAAPEVRLRVSTAVKVLRPKEGLVTLHAMLQNEKNDPVKTAILGALREFKDASSVELVVPHLENANWQVQIAAIETLAAIRVKACIGPLVDLMQTSSGRVKLELRDALEWITGKGYDLDEKSWSNWWKVAAEKFTVPSESEIDQGVRSTTKPKNTFLGIPIESHNVVFVVDSSKSMEHKIEYKAPAGAAGKPVSRKPKSVGSGGSADAPDENPNKPEEPRTYSGQTKLEIVKEELSYVIQQFDDEDKFNVIVFQTKPTAWQKKLMPANDRNKDNALGFVKRMAPEGRTNIYDALLLALDMVSPGGGGGDSKKPDPVTSGKTYEGTQETSPDTIYLLSDGEPTDGEETDRDRIVELIARANSVKKVKIHCIAAGHLQTDLLQAIAASNGGMFVSIGETK